MNLGDYTLIFCDLTTSLARSWIFMMSYLGTKGSTSKPFLSTSLVYSNSVPRCSCNLILSLFSSTRLIHYFKKSQPLLVWVTYLEHVFAHSVFQFVFKRFVLKVKFNFVTVVFAFLRLQSDDIKEHFDSAFGNRFGLMWFGEFYFVSIDVWVSVLVCLLENVLEFLNKKYLVDVDFGPLVNDRLYNVKSFFLSHLINC